MNAILKKCLPPLILLAVITYPLIFWGMFAGDAEIHLIYAKNASIGHFFEFNLGEKSAGVTGPGYMLVLGSLYALFPEEAVPTIIKFMNLYTWFLVLGLVWLLTRFISQSRLAAWIAVGLCGLFPGSVFNANLGMENGLFAFLILSTLYLVVRHEWFTTPKTPIWVDLLLGILMGASCWIRPEGFITGFLFFLCRILFHIHARNSLLKMSGSWLRTALVVIAIAGALLAFHKYQTGRLFPASGSARIITGHLHAFKIGGVPVNLNFTKRMAVYFIPFLAFLFGCIKTYRDPRNQAFYLRMFIILLFWVFFSLYSTILGAAQLSRYTIFVMALMFVLSADFLRFQWNTMGDSAIPSVHQIRLPLFLGFAVVLLAEFAIETKMRFKIAPSHEHRALQNIHAERKRRSDSIAQIYGKTDKYPIVLGCNEVQMRLFLDERYVIRSLDGRVDERLLKFVKDGNFDHIGYFKDRRVDFLMVAINLNKDKDIWALSNLRDLKTGDVYERNGVRFQRLRKDQEYFAVTYLN